jgi:hypothetical protein
MGTERRDVLKILAASGVAAATGILQPGVAEAAGDDRRRVIRRDVAIIGGGSTGTYAAIRLRDLGKSVVVVETKGRLGGHAEKYVDPGTGTVSNMGVVVWHNLPEARSYLARLGVAVQVSPIVLTSGALSSYVDFRTGKPVPGFTPPAPTQLPVLRDLINQYPYLEYGFDLPRPVPAELLMPWGDFLVEHGLDTLPGLVANFGQGLGDIMKQSTLYVMKNFGASLIDDILNGTFLFPVSQNTSEPYEKAAIILGDDVLLNSHVTSADRRRGVVLEVATPDGPRTIHARKLVITAPPLVENLSAIDLSHGEKSLFRRFRPGYYYTGVVRVAGIPDNTGIQNVGADTSFNLPPLPGIYGLTPAGAPNLYQMKYGSLTALTDAEVQANTIADINRLRTAGTFPVSAPTFEAYSNHSPFELTVSNADITDGFYRRLIALQGDLNTFYTGGAFHTQDSAMLWRFTETLIPRIAA